MPNRQPEPPRSVNDVALAFEGGGYRASYTAGMANVLLENNVHIEFVCGISAGASHTIDYISRDQHRVKAAFTMLPSKMPEAGGVRSLLTGHGYFNADYDYWGCVVDGFMPFDWETFANSTSDLRIQSFAAETGESVVWSKSDMVNMRALFDRVRASSTLPWFMKPLTIDGLTMFDGGLGRGAGIPVRLAEDAWWRRDPRGIASSRRRPPRKRYIAESPMAWSCCTRRWSRDTSGTTPSSTTSPSSSVRAAAW